MLSLWPVSSSICMGLTGCLGSGIMPGPRIIPRTGTTLGAGVTLMSGTTLGVRVIPGTGIIPGSRTILGSRITLGIVTPGTRATLSSGTTVECGTTPKTGTTLGSTVTPNTGTTPRTRTTMSSRTTLGTGIPRGTGITPELGISPVSPSTLTTAGGWPGGRVACRSVPPWGPWGPTASPQPNPSTPSPLQAPLGVCVVELEIPPRWFSLGSLHSHQSRQRDSNPLEPLERPEPAELRYSVGECGSQEQEAPRFLGMLELRAGEPERRQEVWLDEKVLLRVPNVPLRPGQRFTATIALHHNFTADSLTLR